MKSDKTKKAEGLSLRKLNYLISILTIIISTVLLVASFMTASRYSTVQSNTNNYILWQQTAEQLQIGSDYLTEEVRSFSVTGDRTHLDNYFNESTVTKQRDTALETIRENLAGSDALAHLERAMEVSVELMDREYYSMRLTVESKGYDPEEFPKEIRDVKLSDADASLSDEEKYALAESLVFDGTYRDYKNEIYKEVRLCVASLAEYTEENISGEFDHLSVLLIVQQVLTIGLIVVIVIVIVLTSVQVISPLISAIPRIKQEKPLPVRGAYEYKYLAKTYNKMFDANQAQKRKLTHAATHDALTGVFNRAGYDKIIASIYNDNYAVLMIDIDGFKSINDTCGHAEGDRALTAVVEEIKKNFREDDNICRVGGDEFVVFMYHITKRNETKTMIRRKIININHSLRSLDVGASVSISAGAAFAHEDEDPETVVNNSDVALYYVKNHGKHDCMFFEDMPDEDEE
ncbi:MAG: GGDEF domain-containing protein [Clostridia bacterium]|nr:GGDEF domain-containing protein [Clostridia bacterium]